MTDGPEGLPGALDLLPPNAPGWLRERVVVLGGSPSPVRRAAAFGVLARLWVVADPAAALRAAIEQGDLGLVGRVRSWAHALEAPVREELTAAARLECEGCRGALARVAEGVRDGAPDGARLALQELVDRRDALEGVRWVLAVGRADRLHPMLERVDRSVRQRWTRLPSPSGLEAERWLAEVAWREPRAWWGALSSVRTPEGVSRR